MMTPFPFFHQIGDATSRGEDASVEITDQEAYPSAVLTSLSHSVDTSRGSRSNVGVFNPNDTPQTVTFSLYSDTGVLLGETSQFLGARQALQINNIFAVVGVTGDVANAYCVVRGNGLRIFAYAAVSTISPRIPSSSKEPATPEAERGGLTLAQQLSRSMPRVG
jgi:hypothetical protein